MVDQARQLNPGTSFRQGNMLDLDIPDGGLQISMDFFLFPTSEIHKLLDAAGFAVEEVIQREPYSPEVEYQSRRAYIFARKRAF